MHQRSELSHGYSRDVYHGRSGPGGHYGTRDYGYDAGNFYPERHRPREGSYEYGPSGHYGSPYERDEADYRYGGPEPGSTSPRDLQGLGVRRNVEEPHRGRVGERSWRIGDREERMSSFPAGGGGYEQVESATWDVPGPYSGHGPKGYRRSDERIHEEVCERLTAHGGVDARQVELRVESGEVTLEGTVPDRRTKRLAEAVAESVRGVEDIHNRLRLERHVERADEADEAAH